MGKYKLNFRGQRSNMVADALAQFGDRLAYGMNSTLAALKQDELGKAKQTSAIKSAYSEAAKKQYQKNSADIDDVLRAKWNSDQEDMKSGKIDTDASAWWNKNTTLESIKKLLPNVDEESYNFWLGDKADVFKAEVGIDTHSTVREMDEAATKAKEDALKTSDKKIEDYLNSFFYGNPNGAEGYFTRQQKDYDATDTAPNQEQVNKDISEALSFENLKDKIGINQEEYGHFMSVKMKDFGAKLNLDAESLSHVFGRDMDLENEEKIKKHEEAQDKGVMAHLNAHFFGDNDTVGFIQNMANNNNKYAEYQDIVQQELKNALSLESLQMYDDTITEETLDRVMNSPEYNEFLEKVNRKLQETTGKSLNATLNSEYEGSLSRISLNPSNSMEKVISEVGAEVKKFDLYGLIDGEHDIVELAFDNTTARTKDFVEQNLGKQGYSVTEMQSRLWDIWNDTLQSVFKGSVQKDSFYKFTEEVSGGMSEKGYEFVEDMVNYISEIDQRNMKEAAELNSKVTSWINDSSAEGQKISVMELMQAFGLDDPNSKVIYNTENYNTAWEKVKTNNARIQSESLAEYSGLNAISIVVQMANDAIADPTSDKVYEYYKGDQMRFSFNPESDVTIADGADELYLANNFDNDDTNDVDLASFGYGYKYMTQLEAQLAAEMPVDTQEIDGSLSVTTQYGGMVFDFLKKVGAYDVVKDANGKEQMLFSARDCYNTALFINSYMANLQNGTDDMDTVKYLDDLFKPNSKVTDQQRLNEVDKAYNSGMIGDATYSDYLSKDATYSKGYVEAYGTIETLWDAAVKEIAGITVDSKDKEKAGFDSWAKETMNNLFFYSPRAKDLKQKLAIEHENDKTIDITAIRQEILGYVEGFMHEVTAHQLTYLDGMWRSLTSPNSIDWIPLHDSVGEAYDDYYSGKSYYLHESPETFRNVKLAIHNNPDMNAANLCDYIVKAYFGDEYDWSDINKKANKKYRQNAVDREPSGYAVAMCNVVMELATVAKVDEKRYSNLVTMFTNSQMTENSDFYEVVLKDYGNALYVPSEGRIYTISKGKSKNTYIMYKLPKEQNAELAKTAKGSVVDGNLSSELVIPITEDMRATEETYVSNLKGNKENSIMKGSAWGATPKMEYVKNKRNILDEDYSFREVISRQDKALGY